MPGKGGRAARVRRAAPISSRATNRPCLTAVSLRGVGGRGPNPGGELPVSGITRLSSA